MSELLVIDNATVRQLLPVPACIEVMAQAFAALARREAEQALRTVMYASGAEGLMLVMPAFLGGDAEAWYGVKVVNVFEGNHHLQLPSHLGAVMLFSATTGEPLALINAEAVTAIRTAAVSGLATRMLARKDAGVLAIIGAGVQARTHLAAIAAVRQLREVRVVSRSPASAARFVAEMAATVDAPLHAVDTPQAALDGADIVAAVTSSNTPVVEQRWLSPGVHINAVGAFQPHTRELDSDTVAAARLFVDQRDSALAEAGDILIPIDEGRITPAHIAGDLAELVGGTAIGRITARDITVFKSLGLPMEDVAAAAYIYQQALERGIGTSVSFN